MAAKYYVELLISLETKTITYNLFHLKKMSWKHGRVMQFYKKVLRE